MGGAEERVPFRADLLLDSLRRLSFQSLHVASSFPCSVASLGLRLKHYLSAQDNLRCRVLTDHMLDLGEPST